jgi:uncharacterized damage-inducible protein DinB
MNAPADAPHDQAAALARIVAAQLRRRLLGELLPRLRTCVQQLGDAGVWRRPAPNCNSVGNLLLHLNGNTTQWILATFGAVADARDRPAEFAAREGATGAELIDALGATWQRACALVDGLSVAELLRERSVQGRYTETGLAAVLHVLEHCAGHAYQVYAWTKQATGQDLRFYDL